MITFFRPGDSLLHRISAGRKLVALLVVVTIIAIFSANLWVGSVSFILILALYLATFDFKTFIKHLWAIKMLVAIVLIPQLFFNHWQVALASTVRLIDVVLLATLFTLTTKNTDLVEVIESLCRPLKRLGIRPETASLTLAMAINAIPMLVKFVANVREAQTARGIKPTPTRMAVPVLIASLKYADDFSEALTARGVEV